MQISNKYQYYNSVSMSSVNEEEIFVGQASKMHREVVRMRKMTLLCGKLTKNNFSSTKMQKILMFLSFKTEREVLDYKL